jgi:hypothetical protein
MTLLNNQVIDDQSIDIFASSARVMGDAPRQLVTKSVKRMGTTAYFPRARRGPMNFS